MGGITTGVGLFSGIDSASLIDQLIASQSRPQILAQQRVIQLKSQQASFLDINSRLNNFKTAAAAFRVNNIFSSRSVSSNNDSVLSATANSSAVPGSYNFIVDRLVSTQQLLTRGFADLDTSSVGLDSLTFESEDARLDSDTALADLNNGDGVTRGKITVNGTEVDLSRAGTVQEVLDAISTVSGVTARVENDHFVITGVTSLSQAAGANILESFGLESYSGVEADQTGTSVYSINGNTSLQSLNDGRGVATRVASGQGVEDFNITIDVNGDGIGGADDIVVGIRIGEIEGELTDDEGDPILDDDDNPVIGVVEGAVSSVSGVIDRINTQLEEAGFSEFNASINTTNGSIDIVDSSGRNFDISNFSNASGVITTADDLGLSGSYTGGTANGSRILAGLNTKLVSSLNGGSGLGLDATDGNLAITTQDGSSFTIDGLDDPSLVDINDIINSINTNANNNGKVIASVNSNGTGIQIQDTTDGGSTFSISGTGGLDAAAALGVSGSFDDGISSGSNLQLAYIGEASLLSELNNGEGIGTGEFEIVDSKGNRATVSITSSDTTIGDVLKKINNASGQPEALEINARINDQGDGIVIEEDATGINGIQLITISNTSGSVATRLGIEGTSTGVDGDNFLDGSFEKTIEFEPDATLSDIRNAINSANVGVSASVLNTGIGTSPFRLNLTSEQTGRDGRFLIDSGTFDLGTDVLDEGNDARVFFGSSDPASAVLMTSSVNQLDGVIQGVTIDLLSRSDETVEVSVSTDNSEIEAKISEFVSAFNSVIDGIDFQTRYDEETETKGTLLGDGTLLNLRNSMFNTINAKNDGFTDTFNSLVEVGITVGSGGELKFDTDKFREAYAEDPEAVENLFTQQTLESNDDDDPNTIDEPTFSELSVLGQLEEFADSYVTSIGGVLQTRSNSIDSQIKLQEDRIESIQKGLDNKRAILQRQFLAMEQAIGAFQSQGSSLSQLAALG
ncbi:MAG: flagellar filament capping protein FliD [Phycisphaerales bacterium]|nr:flagellar filament capping protein FliD [Phycisphaerales bacterium]